MPTSGLSLFGALHFLAEPAFWVGWMKIVLIDLLLAGDNALVIALAVRTLPPREQFWGRIWGTAGAVILRVLFIVIVSSLLKVPLLQVLGGLVLLWIALKLVRPTGMAEGGVRQGASLKEAIGLIIVADVAMSLDNVIAIAAAAKGDFVLIIFGLLLSLPLVVWGSGWLARLMNRFPWIIWVGGGVLGYVAAEMILKDRWLGQFVGPALVQLERVVPWLTGLGLTLLGWHWGRNQPSEAEQPAPPEKVP